MMPELNGYEVCQQLQAQPETAVIPVIMLTAKGNLDTPRQNSVEIARQMYDQMHGYDVGASDFITKPVKAADLLERVRALLWSGRN
jgi:DNA-binding response OmpR family regulator